MLLAASVSQPLAAIPFIEPAPRYHWECVPFAREISGIRIYGDAWTWWDQAEGRYARGSRPVPRAVLAFQPYGAMQLGHVAMVSEIVDARTIRVTHANWSRIDGRRGQIERNVAIRDVSADGDWSRVRVWYAPLGDLGVTAWPVHGFIYPAPARSVRDGRPTIIAKADRLIDSKPSKLTYADVRTLQTVRASAAAEPTGRLAYLGKLLPKLD